MRSIILIFLISLTLFFSVDFFLGNKIVDLLYSFDTIDSPEQIKKKEIKNSK